MHPSFALFVSSVCQCVHEALLFHLCPCQHFADLNLPSKIYAISSASHPLPFRLIRVLTGSRLRGILKWFETILEVAFPLTLCNNFISRPGTLLVSHEASFMCVCTQEGRN